VQRALRAAPWLAFLLSCGPLLAWGFPQGHDWPFELLRVAEYRAALAAGQLPPYWAENLYGGYGSPAFLYYAPLFSACATLFASLLGSVAAGATATLVLVTALSAWLVHRMLRAALELCDDTPPALVAAAADVGTTLFVLHPYLIGDKLLRNACSEFTALCLAPLAIEGLLRAGSRERLAFVAVALGIALSVLAHNLTALAVTGMLLVGGLVLWPPWRTRRPWLPILGGTGAGLALSAFFWLPAFALTPLVRTDELLHGKFDFHRQFQDLLAVFGYERFFSIGGVALVLLGAAGFVLARRPAGSALETRLLAASVAGALALLFLTTSASTFVWESLPLLPFFQFPWRLLGPLAWVLALLAALVFARLGTGAPPERQALYAGGALVLLALNALPLLAQYRALDPEVAARLPQLLEPRAVRSSTLSVTVGDEYLPRAADPAAWRNERPRIGPVVSTSPLARVKVLEESGSRMELHVQAERPSRLRIARWAFPGWQLWLDGTPAELTASRSGSIELRVPAGETRVRLVCSPPRLRSAMLVASGVALAGCLLLLARWRWADRSSG
jgi:hypothetical protein